VLRTFCVIKFIDVLPNNFSPIPHTSLPTVWTNGLNNVLDTGSSFHVK